MSGSSFVLRHYQPDQDLSRLARLLKETDAHDHDGGAATEDVLRERLHWPGYIPELDCWVAELAQEPGWFVGYCSVCAQTPQRCALYIVVLPRWRARGLGTALLEKALMRVHERGAQCIVVNVNAQNEASNRFMRGHGFSIAGSNWLLRASAATQFALPTWPAGFTVQSYAELQDITKLVEAHNRCFADMWGHCEYEQEVTAEMLSSWVSVLNPAGIFVAFAPNGEVAGICRALPADDAGPVDLVDAPGVAPVYRELNLHEPLLLTAMHWLRTKARKPAILQSFGEKEQVVALYRKAGFTLEQRYFSYQRVLEQKSSGECA